MHPFDWSYHHPIFQRVAEIFNVRGSYEYDGCPLYPTNFGRSTLPGLCLDTPLEKGYQLGFTSGGEHEGCGVTMVDAGELTREALFDALFSRRVYGSSGTKMMMDYCAGDTPMGGTKIARESVTLHFYVAVPPAWPIHKIRLMKNSRPFREWTGGNAYDKQIAIAVDAEDAYYYFTVEQQDGEMGWSSPIWIEKAR